MEKKTNSALVAYARRALREGWVYWYGTTGRPCTESLLKRKRAQYPAHYGSARTTAYRRHIAEKRYCADCINLVKGYMWLDEATGKQGYAINGCPDTNADGMFARAAQKGSIETMPDVPGLIVRFSGHGRTGTRCQTCLTARRRRRRKACWGAAYCGAAVGARM